MKGAGAKKAFLQTRHKFLKVCTTKKKGKTTVDLTHLKEEEEQQQEQEQQQQQQGNSLLDESPNDNVNKVPLKQDDLKSWLEFKKLDEGRPVYEIVSDQLSEDGRWSIPVDHPFIHVIVDFAISAFNEVRQEHLKKKKNICHYEIMDCKYVNFFKTHFFYMTMDAIEDGILGVYQVIVGCGVSDATSTLIRFILTDRRPAGKIASMLPHLISQKYRYKTMKAMKKDLEVIISETTEKSMKGKNRRKMAAELIRLKEQHKAMEDICKMLYRQIRSQIPKTWNDRNDGDPDERPARNSGLYPRNRLATCKGYDYHTNYTEFCIYSRFG